MRDLLHLLSPLFYLRLARLLVAMHRAQATAECDIARARRGR